MLPSEIMIWQPEFTDKILSRKPGAVQREAEAKEQARIAEEKRIKDEEERRAKDKAHRKEVNNKILADLIKVGASEDVAKNIITAIVKGELFATKITY
ncbi:hypothetical protein E4525_27470 [Escherichia coli]|nr:hypothetical protein [Escherichia coli]MCI5156642.1 hypothetical protein [Escherichia coli]